ncbi:ribonuclease H-like domain-containing protein [Alkalihalobacillus pseudalcaliphilus]|uniref:ribonuclease H-like domain-containing protein n=1 Tax=Alkalihalobacillus pseudalcaliphilus TaxID=79884 RepID=UPI00064DFB87|nr:ribonuclease H-like domain-containing protein [Alkalihalobacillus pseudalcaliphilus]KMK76358.1 hypothetical protein AB990_14255 [Alkalihalobacillus pseudalcaliphilus]
MKSKLQRMRSHMSLPTTTAPSPEKESQTDTSEHDHLFEKWSELGAQPYWFEDQFIFVIEKSYPIESQHGLYSFSELLKVNKQWQNFDVMHPLSSRQILLENLLFFDTETTGLSSGAGHSIFLLGYSQVIGDEVKVKQYILPGPEAEVAFYHYFLQDLGHDKKLVTYNGKAFDWPKVKTRHTFVRNEVPRLPKVGHFDLLHAARRLWKDILPSCKLSVVEQEVLQFNRVSDTPGYLAPMLYFDYLNEQEPELLSGIIQHHEWDVLSLITLYTHISHLILNGPSLASAEENYQIARWFIYTNQLEIAKSKLNRVLQQADNQKVMADTIYELAYLNKKEKKFDEALIGFLKLAKHPKYAVESMEEAAKIYERVKKNKAEALRLTALAIDHLLLSNEKNNKSEKQMTSLLKRKERLSQK